MCQEAGIAQNATPFRSNGAGEMTVKNGVAIILLLFLGVAAFLVFSKQRGDIYISGADSEYLIPHNYLNNRGAAIYPGKYSGDEGKTLSLFIPGDDRLSPQKDTAASLLIFYDKRYEPRDSLLPLAKRIMRESTYVGMRDGYFEYLKEWRGGQAKYFMTFNPAEGNGISGKDYVVEVELLANVEIGPFRKESIPLCLVHSVADGLALQLSLSGAFCNNNNIRHLKAYQDDLLMNWRKPKQ